MLTFCPLHVGGLDDLCPEHRIRVQTFPEPLGRIADAQSPTKTRADTDPYRRGSLFRGTPSAPERLPYGVSSPTATKHTQGLPYEI